MKEEVSKEVTNESGKDLKDGFRERDAKKEVKKQVG